MRTNSSKFFICALIFALAQFSTNIQAQSTVKTKEVKTSDPIEVLIHEYVGAFESNDWKKIEASVTADYLKQSGGAEAFRKLLPKLKAKYAGATVLDFKKVKAGKNTWHVNYKVRGPEGWIERSDKTWLAVQKIAGDYRIAAVLHDFHPSDKDK